MAAGNFILYDDYKKYQFINKLDLTADAIKVMLTEAGYSVAVGTHGVFADVTNETTDATYTAGGVAVTTPAVTEISAPSGDFKFSSDNVAFPFTANSAALKYAVMYFTGTIDSIVKPLIGYFELESGSTVTVLAGNTLTLQVPANGWYRWNGARS